MDPLTAGLNLANTIILLATKIWDATPEVDKVQRAKEISVTIGHCAEFLHTIQDQVDALAHVHSK